MGSKYDPLKHHRQSIRLKGWDYTNPAAYFITICTYHKQCLFDDPRYREIAENAWCYISNQPHAKYVALDEWIVMPDHFHGIIVLNEMDEGKTSTPPEKAVALGSLPSIVGTYKSMVARRINSLKRSPGGKVWQRGYYERIVRNERELNAIRQYIRANPSRWVEDRDNLDSLIAKMQKNHP